MDFRILPFALVAKSYLILGLKVALRLHCKQERKMETPQHGNASKKRWCIFGPTPIPSTAHPTYKHVVLTAVVGPMHCRSDGHVKNSYIGASDLL